MLILLIFFLSIHFGGRALTVALCGDGGVGTGTGMDGCRVFISFLI
jgi:hypothetical protein